MADEEQVSPGEILRSGVEDQVIDDFDRGAGTRTRYKPQLRYRYAVKGKNYIGDRVSFGYEWHGLQWTAQLVANRYPAGKRVRVRVSPSDASESSLESGITFDSKRRYLLLGMRDHILKVNPKVLRCDFGVLLVWFTIVTNPVSGARATLQG